MKKKLLGIEKADAKEIKWLESRLEGAKTVGVPVGGDYLEQNVNYIRPTDIAKVVGFLRDKRIRIVPLVSSELYLAHMAIGMAGEKQGNHRDIKEMREKYDYCKFRTDTYDRRDDFKRSFMDPQGVEDDRFFALVYGAALKVLDLAGGDRDALKQIQKEHDSKYHKHIAENVWKTNPDAVVIGSRHAKALDEIGLGGYQYVHSMGEAKEEPVPKKGGLCTGVWDSMPTPMKAALVGATLLITASVGFIGGHSVGYNQGLTHGFSYGHKVGQEDLYHFIEAYLPGTREKFDAALTDAIEKDIKRAGQGQGE